MKTRSMTLAAVLFGSALHASPLTEITSGYEWSASVSGGPTVRMALDPDGTGRVRIGPVRRSVTWYEADGGLCITNLPRGDDPQCFVLAQSAIGFLMTAGDGSTIELSRP